MKTNLGKMMMVSAIALTLPLAAHAAGLSAGGSTGAGGGAGVSGTANVGAAVNSTANHVNVGAGTTTSNEPVNASGGASVNASGGAPVNALNSGASTNATTNNGLTLGTGVGTMHTDNEDRAAIQTNNLRAGTNLGSGAGTGASFDNGTTGTTAGLNNGTQGTNALTNGTIGTTTTTNATANGGVATNVAPGTVPSGNLSLNTSQVRQLQTALKSRGFYNGTVDGRWGTGTSQALQSFQSENRLTASGQADVSTLNELGLNGNAIMNTTVNAR
jgi:hypothetical protein